MSTDTVTAVVLEAVTLEQPYCCIALVLLNPLPTNWCHSSMHVFVLKIIKCDFLSRDMFHEQGMMQNFNSPVNSLKKVLTNNLPVALCNISAELLSIKKLHRKMKTIYNNSFF